MAKTKSEKKPAAEANKPADGGWRETVESIAMAVILALLFRGFVAEAFVIPTGSMAPTLQGRHKDVECPKCHVWYQTTASTEVDDGRFGGNANSPSGHHVTTTTCPICRYTQTLDMEEQPNHGSFSGDRIIVGKFAYDFAEPKRWDVIVFKFPGNAVQNYIKRLVGLPGETIRLVGGNVYAGTGPDDDLPIARKPPHKLEVLLQVVDDTNHIPDDLIQAGWPSRWQPWPADEAAWQKLDGGRRFEIAAQEGEAWLRYRHLAPSHSDWQLIASGQLPSDIAERQGQLITDFYAYNAAHYIEQVGRRSWYLTPGSYDEEDYDPSAPGPGAAPPAESLGQHWVDDLAMECLADLQSGEGTIGLLLVRGGTKHICRIDVATGKATLSMESAAGEAVAFAAANGTEAAAPTAETNVRGPGSYRLRLSNVDHEMLLWVNGSVVEFDGPTTYESAELVDPYFSAEDPGDLGPAGVGAKGAALTVSQLKVLRDKYYIATDEQHESNDYIGAIQAPESAGVMEADKIHAVLADPALWQTSNLFAADNRRMVQFGLDKDQFLPLGDNSPQSYDGRLWFPNYPHHYVDRELLIGKALLIYWPHTWNRPIPFTPNFSKMGPIR